ncbi:DUF4192 domain-containing protein [Streptomyces sp. 549]|uniref:DUF4192 domain-containing protein n=1 Tax=Streptomyces sp. 549 TaxID=3049076 RepID=UPI0024C25E16|nr:DUF4192 domain-containing protein [Streptomyces sp. 549]MDK1475959.1 DUF4192 domain-containing protein [Streptomyces sp. 549]
MTHTGPVHDQPLTDNRVTLRGPAELADALPYLLGYHPDDSVVVVGLHGGNGRFGGRIRLGIPSLPQEWPDTARQVAECLLDNSRARGNRPDGALIYLCQEPSPGETPQQAMERLRPLAHELRTACGRLEMPVQEALCLSGGTYWSYCCPDPRCCPAEGSPLAPVGRSTMAAAAAYAGIQVRGSLRELTARLAPLTGLAAEDQEGVLDEAGAVLLPRMLGEADRTEVRAETLALGARLLRRFRNSSRAVDHLSATDADAADDRLLSDTEAAALIVGLQDRLTRDRAAEWMESREAQPALRLWRALSRRCVGAYAEHRAAPLTLAGWVAWVTGDEPSARVAFGLALEADPRYVFARLLHSACNGGLDPEPLRQCLRKQRTSHDARSPHHA